MALGLFWDVVTGLPWTPNGVGSLEPRGYCIFLPGAHYLTINSPYGADSSSLNKLLLLLPWKHTYFMQYWDSSGLPLRFLSFAFAHCTELEWDVLGLSSRSYLLFWLRGASYRIKGRIYSACVQSVLIYGTETWAMKADDLRSLERTERMMVRWMCGVSLKDRKRSEDLCNLGINCVADHVARCGRLRWFGHLERKSVDDWVSACRGLVVEGTRGRGRCRKTWEQCVRDDMKLLGLHPEWAVFRDMWRDLIWGKRLTLA